MEINPCSDKKARRVPFGLLALQYVGSGRRNFDQIFPPDPKLKRNLESHYAKKKMTLQRFKELVKSQLVVSLVVRQFSQIARKKLMSYRAYKGHGIELKHEFMT